MFRKHNVACISRSAPAGGNAFALYLSGQPTFPSSALPASFPFSLTASLNNFKWAFCRSIYGGTPWRLWQTNSSVDGWSRDHNVEEHKHGPPSVPDRCHAPGSGGSGPGNTSLHDTADPGIPSRVIWHRRYWVSRLISNVRLCDENSHVGLGITGLVFQSRSYASKTKRAKSRTEEVSDFEEDVGVTAKENAIKMMETALDVLSKEHAKLRTGRVSAGMLDHITVDAYGVRTPLSHIAAVTVSGLQTLHVLPYDASMVKEVEKAILTSPLGLNPQIDGVSLIVPLPRLTKEHCETMCKLASKAGESAKLTIRRARKEALDSVKKSGSLSKDESKRFEKEVDELTKKYTKSIDEACKKKDSEIMA